MITWQIENIIPPRGTGFRKGIGLTITNNNILEAKSLNIEYIYTFPIFKMGDYVSLGDRKKDIEFAEFEQIPFKYYTDDPSETYPPYNSMIPNRNYRLLAFPTIVFTNTDLLLMHLYFENTNLRTFQEHVDFIITRMVEPMIAEYDRRIEEAKSVPDIPEFRITREEFLAAGGSVLTVVNHHVDKVKGRKIILSE